VYGITDSAAEGLFGGWAQKVYIEPGVVVAKLPDAVTFDAYIGDGLEPAKLAVDIVDRELDPEDLGHIIGAFRDACAVAVARFGGSVAKYMGDGALVIGAPPTGWRWR
jgi:class 3 adenylate cyclase